MLDNKNDNLRQLERAQELINEAINLIREVVEDTSQERYVEAYMIAHLENWANEGNPHDSTIPILMEWFENEDNWMIDEE